MVKFPLPRLPAQDKENPSARVTFAQCFSTARELATRLTGGKKHAIAAWRIAGIYAICGTAWIFLSDYAGQLLPAATKASLASLTPVSLQTLKGWGFIGITSFLLFRILHFRYSELDHATSQLAQSYEATLRGWAKALDLRDHSTEEHTERVTELSCSLARRLGVTDTQLEDIRRGAMLHDIGKIGIPDHILRKEGKLNDEEWICMRKHPEYARSMLASIPFLQQALDIPYCHHERYDGSGYPRGLAGTDIPFAARIFAVVDVWDAIRNERPYHAPMNREEAKAYLWSEAGRLFDPVVVDAFLQLIEERELKFDEPHVAGHFQDGQSPGPSKFGRSRAVN